MNPQLFAIALMTAGDILVDILVPANELPEEFKLQVRTELQLMADKSEKWLEDEIAKLKAE